MRASTLTLCAIAVLLVAAPFAAAQDNSAIDQYTESVPGAGGDSRNDEQSGSGDNAGDGGASPDGSPAPLPAESQAGLEAAGSDGAAAAALAQTTAPQSKSGKGSAGQSGQTGDKASGSGVAPLGSVIAGDSDGGIGLLLPILMGVTLLAFVAVAALRRRRGAAAGSS